MARALTSVKIADRARLTSLAARFRRLSPVAPYLAAVAVGIIGMWLALSLAGRMDYDVGPFRVELFLRPGRGMTEISLPPLGHVRADTHRPPIRLTATLVGVDPMEVSSVVARQDVDGLLRLTEREAYAALRTHAIRSLVLAAGGALAAGLLAFRRRWKRVLVAMVAGVVAFGGSMGLSWATFQPEAFLQPTFTGPLSLAPRLIGPLREATGRIEDFRSELARLVGAATEAYDVIRAGPGPSSRAIVVLHISDIHLSPIGMDFAQSLAQTFEADVIVDTGDLTSFGTPLERTILERIPQFDVPYVFVPGNHDSAEVTGRVAAFDNAIVLNGESQEVAGLRIFGAPHPLFTPEESRQIPSSQIEAALEEAGKEVLRSIAVLHPRPDLVAVHDDRMAEPSAGLVPLVISGHFHEHGFRVEEGTIFLRAASTGAGGLTGLGDAVLSAQILYLEGDPPELVAYDLVELDPRTGDLTLKRTLVEALLPAVGPSPAPVG